jgi:hypothetical protein
MVGVKPLHIAVKAGNQFFVEMLSGGVYRPVAEMTGVKLDIVLSPFATRFSFLP